MVAFNQIVTSLGVEKLPYLANGDLFYGKYKVTNTMTDKECYPFEVNLAWENSDTAATNTDWYLYQIDAGYNKLKTWTVRVSNYIDMFGGVPITIANGKMYIVGRSVNRCAVYSFDPETTSTDSTMYEDYYTESKYSAGLKNGKQQVISKVAGLYITAAANFIGNISSSTIDTAWCYLDLCAINDDGTTGERFISKNKKLRKILNRSYTYPVSMMCNQKTNTLLLAQTMPDYTYNVGNGIRLMDYAPDNDYFGIFEWDSVLGDFKTVPVKLNGMVRQNDLQILTASEDLSTICFGAYVFTRG